MLLDMLHPTVNAKNNATSGSGSYYPRYLSVGEQYISGLKFRFHLYIDYSHNTNKCNEPWIMGFLWDVGAEMRLNNDVTEILTNNFGHNCVNNNEITIRFFQLELKNKRLKRTLVLFSFCFVFTNSDWTNIWKKNDDWLPGVKRNPSIRGACWSCPQRN